MTIDLLELARLSDEPGPAEPLSRAEAERAVERALSGAGYATAQGATPFVRPRRRWWPAALGLGFAATAAAGYSTDGFGVWPSPASVTPAPFKPSAAPQQQPRPSLAAPALSVEVAQPEPEAEPAVSNRAPLVSSQSDRLKLANTQRKLGKFGEAFSIYAAILRESPQSKEAYVARVAAADLKLEKLGDAAGALSLYTAAHQGGGYLAAQAHWGMAASYRALGRQGEEVQALRDIVALYPPGLLRNRADVRLVELGVR